LTQELTRLIKTLQTLKKPSHKASVVLMPDFFLDNFLAYNGTLNSFISEVSRVAEQGGGNIPRTNQVIQRGGNATNTASALSTLGIKTHIILRTNPLGLTLLKHFLGKNVDLSHVKTDGKMALTVALELKNDERKVNVMLGYPGSVADFGFNSLSKDDLSLIGTADYVCVLNWNQNLHSTELAGEVFKLVKRKGRGKTFFDSGDPSPRKNEIKSLVRKVLMSGTIDVLSLNENEAVWYASYFNKSIAGKRREKRLTDLAIEAARILRNHLKIRLDLHTPNYTATLERKEYVVPTFRIPIRRVTGAGDTWNAADIFGEIMELPPEQRLLFANAAAAFYISTLYGRHPSVKDIVSFLKSERMKIRV
jgi:ribokinase